MAEGSSFDVSKMTTAAKIILGSGIVYLINLFLPWQKVCVGGGSYAGVTIPSICPSINGTKGIGWVNLILVIVIIAMEIMVIMGLDANLPMEAKQRQVTGSGLVGLLLILTLLKVLLIDNDFLSWPAWLGIVLAAIMGYGGFMRFQESQSAGGATPPSEGGGFSS
jgi:hypothetical protein